MIDINCVHSPGLLESFSFEKTPATGSHVFEILNTNWIAENDGILHKNNALYLEVLSARQPIFENCSHSLVLLFLYIILQMVTNVSERARQPRRTNSFIIY